MIYHYAILYILGSLCILGASAQSTSNPGGANSNGSTVSAGSVTPNPNSTAVGLTITTTASTTKSAGNTSAPQNTARIPDNGPDSGENATEIDNANNNTNNARTSAPVPTLTPDNSSANDSAPVPKPTPSKTNSSSSNVTTTTPASVAENSTLAPNTTSKTPGAVTAQTTINKTVTTQPSTAAPNTTNKTTKAVTTPGTGKASLTTKNSTSAVTSTPTTKNGTNTGTTKQTTTKAPAPGTNTALTTNSSKAPETSSGSPVSTNATVPSAKPSAKINATTLSTKPSTTNASTAGPVTVPTVISTNSTGIPSTTVAPTSSTGKVTQTPSVNEKVFINEVMVNKDGGFQTIELCISAVANISHYAMVIVDGSASKKEIINLGNIQQKNGLLTISINSTLHVLKDIGTGIAVYDTKLMTSLGDANWTLSKQGLMDSLVIGKTYNISTPLLETLTTDNNPFVLDPAICGSMETISRCSQEYLRNTDMFMLTSSSLGNNNADTCLAKMNVQKLFALKFNADCSSLNETMAREIMKYVVKEFNRVCHCGLTRLHVQDINLTCCPKPFLKIKFVIPSDAKGLHLLDSYKQFIDKTSSVQLDKNTYQLDNKCDEYKQCCQLYKGCCPHPMPIQKDDSEKNVKVTVAAVVSCLVVFMIIVVLVILYMRRKKTVNYQFRMSRLREDDEDLMMDGAEGDDFVGGQEATFDIKS